MSQHNKKYLLFFLIVAVLSAVVLLGLINCTPPISRDALTHHLAVPKLYLIHGGIYEIPDLIFSYYPMNLELLYLIPLKFGNDIVPKFIHMFFGLATAWLIYSYLKKRLGTNWGLTGTLFFLTTPVVIHLATSAYVDLGVTFFTTASLLVLLQWSSSKKTWFLFLAGLCAGLAAGTKYNGLITLFLLTCFIPFLETSDNEPISVSKKIKPMLVFFCCALIVLSPWLIRNFLWTANPIYPLFQSIFNEEPTPLTQGMNPFLVRKLVYNEPLWQTLLIPVRIFFEGQDNNPQYFDGVLNPFILLFSSAALLPTPKSSPHKTDKKLFLWFAVLFLLFAFVQRVIRIRYIVPALPCLIILSIFGLYNLRSYLLSKQLQRTATVLPALLLLVALSINGLYLIHYWQKIRPLQYLSGQVDRTTFITRFRPEYPLIQYANNNLPGSVTILAVFLGNRGYYFDRRVRFDFKSGKSLLCSLVQDSGSAKAVAISLSKQGITHLLIRHDLFNNWVRQQLSTEEQRTLTEFISNYTQQIAVTKNHSLLSLLNVELGQKKMKFHAGTVSFFPPIRKFANDHDNDYSHSTTRAHSIRGRNYANNKGIRI